MIPMGIKPIVVLSSTSASFQKLTEVLGKTISKNTQTLGINSPWH